MYYCSACGAPLEENAAFCSACGASVNKAETPVYTQTVSEPQPEAPKKKKGKVKFFAIAAVALFLVFSLILSVVAVGYFTSWFGLVSPMHGLLTATVNTVKAESGTVSLKNFSVSYDAEDEYDEIEIEAINSFKNVSFRYNIDYKGEDVNFILVAEGKESKYDSDEGEYYLVDYSSKVFLYKDTLYSIDNEGGDSYAAQQDVELDNYFDYYERFVDEDGVNWKKLLRELELDDYIDDDEIEPFFEEVYKEKLRDKKWLKDKLGFEKSFNTYTFKPDLEELTDELYEIILDSDLLSSEARSAVRNTRSNAVKAVSRLDLELEIKITVKGKYISTVNVKGEVEDVSFDATVAFSKMNKTKIGEAEIKSLRKEAEKIIEDNVCSQCGIQFNDYYDKKNHGNCSGCGAHGYIGYGSDDNLCYECWWGY